MDPSGLVAAAPFSAGAALMCPHWFVPSSDVVAAAGVPEPAGGGGKAHHQAVLGLHGLSRAGGGVQMQESDL